MAGIVFDVSDTDWTYCTVVLLHEHSVRTCREQSKETAFGICLSAQHAQLIFWLLLAICLHKPASVKTPMTDL